MKNPGFAGAVTGAVAVAVTLMAAGVDIDPARAGNGVTIAFVIGIMAGGFSGVALRRGLRGASSGFWHSVPGRWLIGRIAGLAVIALLAAPVFYAVAFATGMLLYLLYLAFGAAGILAMAKVIGAAIDLATVVIVWRLRTPVKVMIGKGSRPFRRWYRSFNMGRGGSSGFASILEEWANRWRPGMIFFGHSIHDRHWPVGIKDDRMVMTIAGNGGGKGESGIIPNALTYPGSMFINDTKGQNAAVTAEARRAMGQDVHVLSPFGAETAHLNPLAGLDPEAGDYVERIKGIVEALVIATDEKNRVWAEWSKIVIEGLIDLEIRYSEESGDE